MTASQRQPADPPAEGASPAQNPPYHGIHGIPHDQHEHDPAGTPSGDRHDTETAPMRIEKEKGGR